MNKPILKYIFVTNNRKKAIALFCILFLLFGKVCILAQQVHFSVRKTSFSSSSSDDFSPVFYKNGLVFCSNAINTSLMSFRNDNENLFDILYVEEKDSGNWKSPVLLSESLTTMFNEGPSTFSPNGDKIYFSRNNEIEGKLKEINDPSNTLGIFSAENIDGKWINITPFPFNSKEYSIGTPSLSPDGNTLYFASDMPGGLGGTDIYYCKKDGEKWSKPVNLGEKINSPANESYPFACKSGKLFYSSDKPGGFGGKDIYFSLPENGNWSVPFLVKAEINSKGDDYGIVTDINMDGGYFSSNRKGATNIYHFITEIPQIWPCDEQGEFKACFNFYDERYTDSLHLEYEWDFGHGIKQKGIRVKQCFDRPGTYSAVLTIIHNLADSVFETKSNYNFEVPAPKAPYVFTDKPVIAGNTTLINASTGKENIKELYWDLNGEHFTGLNNIRYTFKEKGKNEIGLGAVYGKNKEGYKHKKCIKTYIQVYADEQEMATNAYPLIGLSNKAPDKTTKSRNQYLIHPYLAADLQSNIADSMASTLCSLSSGILEFTPENRLTEESQYTLDNLVSLLNKAKNIRLVIAVHESNKGPDKQNLEKSQVIAKAMKEYIQGKSIDHDRISTIGYGPYRPLNPGIESKTHQTRRIEFIYINK